MKQSKNRLFDFQPFDFSASRFSAYCFCGLLIFGHLIFGLSIYTSLNLCTIGNSSTVYTLHQLLSLRRQSSLLPEFAVDRVRSLSLRRFRGVRGGRNKPRPIRTIGMKSSGDRRPSVICKQTRLFTSVTANHVLYDCSLRTVPDPTLRIVSLPRPM